MRKSKDQGGREYERMDFRRPAFVVLQPNGPWLECMVLDISSGGARLEVGAAPFRKCSC
ncbi:MAG: PilZ domain-containing protein [Rhizobiales bacterium]|nr:PilZ domain-containing protein [Hyphomicrobiales bacterium]